MERAIEPLLPIIDPHHHFWPSGGHATIYMVPELIADLSSGHNVRATVYTESLAEYGVGPSRMGAVEETRFVMGCVADAPPEWQARMCAGIVGFADLMDEAQLQAILDDHALEGAGRFRGIRQVTMRDADPALSHFPQGAAGMLAEPAFHRSMTILARRGLLFEALVFHPQLREVAALANSCPDTPIVVNHCGLLVGLGAYAQRRDEEIARWRSDLAVLKRFANVRMKLGGLGTSTFASALRNRQPRATFQELAAEWKPIIESVIEQFGVERCMFESNYPVDGAVGSYVSIWNAFKSVVSDYSSSDKDWLFFRCAQETYALPVHRHDG